MNKKKKFNTIIHAALAEEKVQRYGSAVKEHVVAYSGKDNETNKILKKCLKKNSKSKVNPDYEYSNIKQQAGFSAEVKYTARQNTEKIINGKKERYTRTDDIGRFNDPLYDHVILDENNNVVDNTGEQMKFVGSNPRECLNKLKSSKYEKYINANAKITIPKDYYYDVLDELDKDIAKVKREIDYLKENGNENLYNARIKEIEKLQKLKSNIRNSEITNKEAIFARKHPMLSTIKDINSISHRAGWEQSKVGFTFSGGISVIKNIVAVTKGKKNILEGAKDVLNDATEGGCVAYVQTYAGTTLKGFMQNSKKEYVRNLSKTNVPTLLASSIIDVGQVFLDYVDGNISLEDCVRVTSSKVLNNVGSNVFSVIGQTAIPIPVVGGFIGSMVGYTLSSVLYNELKSSLDTLYYTRDQRFTIEKQCNEMILMLREYREDMNGYYNQYLFNYKCIFDSAFIEIDNALKIGDIDSFISGVNKITKSVGKTPQFENFNEFDNLMKSENKLKL